MKISIITVCLNNSDTIEDAICSIQSQDHTDKEHIVIDGGSTDGTIDIVNRYKDKIDLIISEPDNGIYDAMNKGIYHSSGDIVGILNADDVYADNNVLSSVANSLRNPKIPICYGDLIYVFRKNSNKIVRYWKPFPNAQEILKKGDYPPHPTLFLRKEIYLRYGSFDLNFLMAADVELMVRLIGKYQLKSAYIPRILVKMKTGGESNKSFKNILLQNYWIYKAYKQNKMPFPIYFFLRKIGFRLKQFIIKPKTYTPG